MSGRSLVDQIRHYQRDIERCPENKERMIRCIQRLYVLPILVQHLQETGVGRSVNSLRKYEGDVGNAAKALVAKWKAMVAAEEAAELEQMEQREEQEKPPDPPPSASDVRESENGKYKSKKSSSSSSDRHQKRRDEDRSSHKKSSHRHHRDSDSHKSKKTRRHSNESDSSPSRKKRKKNCVRDKRRHHDEDESESESEVEEEASVKQSSADEEEAVEEEASVQKSSDDERDASENDSDSSDSSSDHRHRSKKSSHSSKDKPSSSSSRYKSSSSKNKRNSESEDSDDDKQSMKDLIKENERKMKRERHESSKASTAGESSQKSESSPAKNKVKVKIEKLEDGIDGTSGFSFADALLGVESSPKKKKKKSETSSKSPNHVSGSSSSSRKDKPSSSSSKSHGSSSKSHHSSSSKHSSSSSKSHHSSSHRSSSSSNHHSSSSKKTDANIPDLLRNPVKMESLDFDINSTLPEITPNYKPLPHIPDRKPPKPLISDEDHMFNLMTTKNQRTKVYSGAKYGACSSVPSLYSLCIQLLFENIDAVEYTGGVPYDILKPLLQKLNSDQLYVIEHFNSYLIEDTDLLWEFHCKKDFRSEKRQDMESWRELYLRCMDEREKKLKALTANINESIAKSTPVRTAKLAYVDSMAKPPRSIARKQARYGTGSSSTATIASLGANTAQKQEIISKAMVGANTPGIEAPVSVSAPSNPRTQTSFSSATVKKKKAPLMAKALQLIKGNRFKR